jgi:hypothetical protein
VLAALGWAFPTFSLRSGRIMAFDNFTPTRVRALQECPQGQQPGEVFEVTADVADILVRVEAVERVSNDTPLGKPNPRGTYKRRDLRSQR